MSSVLFDRALAGIFDGHDAEIGDARLDLVENLIDRGQRQRAHGMAELLEHRRLRERALGSEESRPLAAPAEPGTRT